MTVWYIPRQQIFVWSCYSLLTSLKKAKQTQMPVHHRNSRWWINSIKRKITFVWREKNEQNKNNNNLKSAAGAKRDVMVSVPQQDYMIQLLRDNSICGAAMICLRSDCGEKNQSSRTQQVPDAVSRLAMSLHLRLYSQRFSQVLPGARGSRPCECRSRCSHVLSQHSAECDTRTFSWLQTYTQHAGLHWINLEQSVHEERKNIFGCP